MGCSSSTAETTTAESQQGDTLTNAGWLYLVGDTALAVSGMMSGRSKEAAAGLIYSVGGLVPAFYGKQPEERVLHNLYRRMWKFLQENHAVLPKHSPITAAVLAAPGGVLEKVQDFLYAYPSQILNGVYAVGGVQLLRSGLQHHKGWDAASGALVAAGGLAGMLVPEKAPDPAHPPTTFTGKAWEWVQEKPLRLSGYLYTAQNAMLAMSVWDEWKRNPAQKSWVAKLVTVGAYVVGNALLSMSSKDNSVKQTPAENDVMDALERVSAQILAAQPPAMRAQVLHQVAGFLAAQTDVGMKAADIAHGIEQRLYSLAGPTMRAASVGVGRG